MLLGVWEAHAVWDAGPHALSLQSLTLESDVQDTVAVMLPLLEQVPPRHLTHLQLDVFAPDVDEQMLPYPDRLSATLGRLTALQRLVLVLPNDDTRRKWQLHLPNLSLLCQLT